MKTATENGFEAAGIYPFDPDAVDYTKSVKNTIEKLHQKEDPLIQDQALMNRFFTMLNDVKLPLADQGIDIAPIKKEIQNYFSSYKLNGNYSYTNSETQENDSTTIPSTEFVELVLPDVSILNVPIIDVEEKILQEGCIDDEKDMDLELNKPQRYIADLKFLDEIDQLIQEKENAKATTSNMGPILKSNDGDKSPLLYVPSCSKTSSGNSFLILILVQ
uniref:Uncharacterized protein n=1 Tax=Trichogramma kaykai TaxID=54128 RepID=A0ABD2VZ74_9HYME